MDSPHKHATDSPSKQLLLELGRLRLDAEENFHARLERVTSEREKAHKAALAAAAIEHERVRRSAEAAAERFQLELEKEKKRREDEERQELDKKRQEKIERELAERRREIERAKMTEEEERRVAEARKAQAEAAVKLKLARQREDAEVLRQREEAEQANKKAQDAAAAAERTAVAQLPEKPIQASQPAIPEPAPSIPSYIMSSSPHINPDREVEHQQYRAIHQRLKEMRRFMIAQGKLDPNLKKKMGDMRREIKKCVGQLTEGKGANKGPVQTPSPPPQKYPKLTAPTDQPSYDGSQIRRRDPHPHNLDPTIPRLTTRHQLLHPILQKPHNRLRPPNLPPQHLLQSHNLAIHLRSLRLPPRRRPHRRRRRLRLRRPGLPLAHHPLPHRHPAGQIPRRLPRPLRHPRPRNHHSRQNPSGLVAGGNGLGNGKQELRPLHPPPTPLRPHDRPRRRFRRPRVKGFLQIPS